MISGATGGQLMFIEGRWVDMASPEFQKTMSKMKGAAQKTSRQMKGMVDENLGRAMSQFNEKTEKGRQLLTAFGGAVGGAAGNVVYYTGTLSYVIGRFGVWELAIMGVVAAIGGLIWALSRETKEEKKWREGVEKSTESLKEWKKATDDLVQSEIDRIYGLDQLGVKQRVLQKDIDDHTASVEKLIAKEDEWLSASVARYRIHSPYREMIDKENKLIDDQTRALEELKKKEIELLQLRAAERGAVTVTAFPKDKEEGDTGGKKKAETELEYMLAHVDKYRAWQQEQAKERMDLEQAMTLVFLEEEQKKIDILQERADLESLMTEVAEEEAQRRMEIMEEEMLAAEEKIRHQHETVRNSIGIFSELGDVLTKGTKANTAARIAAIVMEAAWDAAVYTYKGFEALAKPDPWEAAMHFTAAGMAAAVAAGRVAGAAGGGGGASVGARDRAQGGWAYREDVKREHTIHVHIDIGKKRFGDAVVQAVEDELDRDDPGRKRPKVT